MKKIVLVCSIFLMVLSLLSYFLPYNLLAEVKDTGASKKTEITSEGNVGDYKVTITEVKCEGSGSINCQQGISTIRTDKLTVG